MLDAQKPPQLQPAYGLWKRVAPERARYRFRAGDPTEARRWQTTTRRALERLLLRPALPPAPLAPQQIEAVDKGDYVREKVLLRTSRDTLMPVYLLLPKNQPRPLPVVVAFHGHGYGVKDIVGLWEDGTERDISNASLPQVLSDHSVVQSNLREASGYQKDFAVALCRRGFAVAAPEISCFGERQSDFSALGSLPQVFSSNSVGQSNLREALIGQEAPTTCVHTALLAFYLGGSALGLRLHDSRRLIDYLATRADLDGTHLGAMGISGGGMLTFFSACLDERIRACVVSGYYCTFRDSILAMDHCPCNIVPGLHRFGEMYDLVGLIAPRPLLIEAGSRDPIFPIAAVKRSVERAREVYGVLGAPAYPETDYFEGRHQISGRRAYDFLAERL